MFRHGLDEVQRDLSVMVSPGAARDVSLARSRVFFGARE